MLVSGVPQSESVGIHIYPLFLRLFSQIGHYTVLSRVPCAIWWYFQSMFENTNIFIRMIFNTDFRQYSLGWLKSLTNYLERTISNLSFLFYWYFPRDIAFCINFKIETQFINLVFSTHIKIFTNHMCYWESSPLFLLNPVFIGTILQIKKIWAFPSIFHPQLYNRLHSLEVMVLKKKKKKQ